jgi:hypothetical protein
MGFIDFFAHRKQGLLNVPIAFVVIILIIGVGSTALSPLSESVDRTEGAPEEGVNILGNCPPNQSPIIPERLSLAGEIIPMNTFGVLEQLDRELVVNAYRHGSTMLYMKRSARWFPIIQDILKQHEVPDDFKYLAVIESGLTQVVSPAGAAGFWQFMKGTAPQFGLKVSTEIDERYHITKSTHAACAYLLEAKEEFGSWSLAAASYNMGMAGVSRELEQQGVDSYWDLHLNAETARYVYRLLAIKAIFEAPEQYGFLLEPDMLYDAHEVQEYWVRNSVPDLASYALSRGSNLKELKMLNPWLRKDKLSVTPGDSIRIVLPKIEV